MIRIECLGLTFALGERTFVVARSGTDRPVHVTLSWNNPSGEVDLHLTYDAHEPGGQREHERLLQIRQEDLTAEGERVADLARGVFDRLRREIMPVTPEWLWFRRYVIVLPEKKEFEAVLRSAIPKSRGKYRWHGIKEAGRDQALRRATLRYFRPSVLRQLVGSDVTWPLMAMPLERHGVHQQMLSIGHVVQPDGSVGWTMFRPRHAARAFEDVGDTVVRRLAGYVRPELGEIWDRIVAALELDRIAQLRGPVHRVGQFFRDPHLALGTARRRP